MNCNLIERITKLNESISDKLKLESEKIKFRDCLKFYIRNGISIDELFNMVTTAIVDLKDDLKRETVHEIAKIFKEVARDYVEIGYTRVFEFLKDEIKRRTG